MTLEDKILELIKRGEFKSPKQAIMVLGGSTVQSVRQSLYHLKKRGLIVKQPPYKAV